MDFDKIENLRDEDIMQIYNKEITDDSYNSFLSFCCCIYDNIVWGGGQIWSGSSIYGGCRLWKRSLSTFQGCIDWCARKGLQDAGTYTLEIGNPLKWAYSTDCYCETYRSGTWSPYACPDT